MIYLSSVYSHPEPEIRARRFEAACCIAARMISRGEVVYSPIVSTHPIAVLCDMPTTCEFWHKQNEAMLRKADKLVVVKMDGWDKSKGISVEVEFAKSIGLPVEYREANE
jgi:hypothetical protein